MHFSTIFSAAAALLITTTTAAPLHHQKRDLATITSVIDTIITDSGKIADVVRNFDGSPLGAIGLLQPSTDLQNAITDGTAKIQATDSLNLIDTLKLLPKINELSTATSESLDLLIEKKPLFDQAGVTAIVLDNLKKQQAGSAALQDAISSKLPSYIPQFIKDLAGQGTKQKLQEAVDKFSEPAATATAPAA